MFVAILHRIDGEKEEGECKFEDVPSGAYYEKAVAWASTNGIVAGISATEFNPNSRYYKRTNGSDFVQIRKLQEDRYTSGR